jgi:C1A family cysteine protease
MRALSFVLLSCVALGCRDRAPPVVDAGPAVVAPKEVGAALKPPALRVPHPAAPALPDLPALEAHEPPSTSPGSVRVEGSPCRSVWTGLTHAPLTCVKAALMFGSVDGGTTELVPHAALATSPLHLPAVVDHRLEGTEGPVRDQGSVPACTAFATATALDHAIARWSGKAPHVSVMQIWSRYHTPIESRSIAANLGQGLGAEEGWPFKVAEANGWIDCQLLDQPKAGTCGKPVDPARANQEESHAIAAFTHVESLPAIDTAVFKEHLAAGQDIVVGMDVSDAFVPKGKAGGRYIPNYTKVGADAGHAMVVAGYATLPHGTYFLLHNSWGPAWGDGGYAWIHETTLKAWGHESLVLDAEPSAPTTPQRPKRSRGETTCDGTLVPDSIRGTCAPACPDGSPRHDGVCAIANACPAGFVNLTGVCVLAAPSASGRDASTGIAWTCGPGGCAYTVPKAADPACTGGTCKASCPAPDFRLARSGRGLTCVE